MITFQHIRQALALPTFDGVSAQMAMSPSGRPGMQPDPNNPPRQSAVLILVYPRLGQGLHLVLTKRTATLRGHSGQVSFPGGKRDPEDASFEATALRETCEELGICDSARITLLGRLACVWIPPSNFNVMPVVAMMQSEPKFTPNPHEVASVLHLSLRDLLDDGRKCLTQMHFRGRSIDVPYYDVDDEIVWGATCMILSELEQRLHKVLKA